LITLAACLSSLGSWFVKQVTHSMATATLSVSLATSPVVSIERIVNGSDLVPLLFLDRMVQLLVLSLLEVVFSQNQVLAATASLGLRDGIDGSLEVDLASWVLEVGDLSISIDVHTHLGKCCGTTLLAEHGIVLLVHPVARLAEQFESLDTRQTHAVKVQELEAHLDYHVLHCEIGCYKLYIVDGVWVQDWLLFLLFGLVFRLFFNFFIFVEFLWILFICLLLVILFLFLLAFFFLGKE
jgi:hypothetical protein